MSVAKPKINVRNPSPQVHGSMTPMRVVLHDTESHDVAGLSDITAIYSFWVKQGLGYDAHFIVDAEGNIGQSGTIDDLFYHVGGLNTGSIGIEQVGFASLAKLAWSKKRRRQVFAVAHLLAWLNTEHGIPLRFLSGPGIYSSGVTTHAEVSKLEAASEGHTDPGANYPVKFVLWLARRIVMVGFKTEKAQALKS